MCGQDSYLGAGSEHGVHGQSRCRKQWGRTGKRSFGQCGMKSS